MAGWQKLAAFWTTKYSFRPFGERIFTNVRKNINFHICVKQAVFGCNYAGAVQGQSYVGSYGLCKVLNCWLSLKALPKHDDFHCKLFESLSESAYIATQ